MQPVGGHPPDGDQKPPLSQRIRDGWGRFCKFMWNSNKKEVMGRSGKSWGQIGLFYLCFYTCLAGFWAVLFAIFFQTVPMDRPKYISLVDPPGLTYFPFTDKVGRIEYGIANDDEDRKRIEEELDYNVFQVLEMDQSSHVDCPDTPDIPISDPPTQRFCRYDPSLLGPCAPDSDGLYDTMEPCLYIGLNKVWGWVPENYNPDEIPDELESLEIKHNITIKNRIIFTCQIVDGRANSIDIYPKDGISFGHYPYVTGTDTAQQARYIRPLVAVKIRLLPGVDVRVECRARVRNLEAENQPGGLFSRGKSEVPAVIRIRLMVRDAGMTGK